MNTPTGPYRDFITARLDELAQTAQEAHNELLQLFAAEDPVFGHLTNSMIRAGRCCRTLGLGCGL